MRNSRLILTQRMYARAREFCLKDLLNYSWIFEKNMDGTINIRSKKI